MLSLAFSPTARRSAVVAGLIASTVACSDDTTAPKPAPRVPAGISAVDNPDLLKLIHFLPPVIDGKIGQNEWTGAATASFMATLPGGAGQTPVLVYIKRDKTYLYLATVFDRMSPFHEFDRVAFEFDADNDGKPENGDDIVFIGAAGTQNVQRPTFDFYRFQGGAYNQGDIADGGTTDAVGAWGATGTKAVFEIRHPLNSADNAHDISIDPSNGPVTVGMKAMLQLEEEPAGSYIVARTYLANGKYCKLTIGQYTSISLSCPAPA